MATKNTLLNKKILVTSGPTWVPIDNIRVISNCASGEIGNIFTELLRKEKAKVTLLQGPTTQEQRAKPNRLLKFCFYQEFDDLLRKELKKSYDVVIHAAAVSDYRLSKPYKAKISSRLPQLRLCLVPTKKLIGQIKKRNPNVFLVGFKLENTLTKKQLWPKVRDLFQKADCDLVVANTLKDNYQGLILDEKKNILASAKSREVLVKNVIRLIKKRL